MAGEGEGGVGLAGFLLEDGCCCWVELANDGGDVWFDDACFFGGDELEGIAEDVHMVVADVGNDGEVGGDDIGAIKASSEAGFDDCDVDLLFDEVVECHGDGDFEEGRFYGVDERLDALYEPGDIVFCDHLAVDADAFAEVVEVWGGVEACFIAGGLKDGGEHVAGGAFAVGASDMDGFEPVVGVAERFTECDGIGQVCFDGGGSDAAEHGEAGEQVIDRFVVIHLNYQARWCKDGIKAGM